MSATQTIPRSEISAILITMYRLEEVIHNMCIPPNDVDEFNAWLEQTDIINFLANNSGSQEIVLYASVDHTFIHTILIPKSQVEPPDIDYLLSWDGNPTAGRRVNSDGKTKC